LFTLTECQKNKRTNLFQTQQQQKQMNKKGYKNTSCSLPILEVKAEEKWNVEGYFAGFNNIDADKDRILQGAFTKSIQEHGPQSSK
jgi:phage head maturation protease